MPTNTTSTLPLYCGLGLGLVLGLASACKGETEYKDKPETLDALTACRESVGDKDKYVKDLEARIYDLEKQAEGAQDNELVVTVAGDEVVITPAKDTGNNKPTGPGVPDEELFKNFVSQVQKSRGSMQRCYTNALKKDSGLQVRTVTLKIQVKFKSDGSVSRSTFTPDLSDSFSSCMEAVTKKWTLEGTRAAITFQQPVTLSPQ